MENIKIGNVSQTIVPVPYFYMTDGHKELETFKLHHRAKPKPSTYFTEGAFFKKPLDLNINHNPRFNVQKAHRKNIEKYIPFYKRSKSPFNLESNNTLYSEMMNNSLPQTLYPALGNENSKEFMKTADVNHQFPDYLRNGLMGGTIKEIERLNETYKVKTWRDLNTRINNNRFYDTAPIPITEFINRNKSMKDEFMDTLNDKIGSLKTVNSRAKENIENIQERKRKEVRLDDYSHKAANDYLDQKLDQNRQRLLLMRYKGEFPFNFYEQDQKFLEENAMMTCKTQDPNVYNKLSPGNVDNDIRQNQTLNKNFNNTALPGINANRTYNY